MFNLLQLQQERQHKLLSARDIQEKAERAEGGSRPMTPEECALIDRLLGEIATLDDRIAEVLAHQRRAEAVARLTDSLERPAGRQVAPEPPARPDAPAPAASFKVPAQARRTGVLKAFKGPDAELKAYRCGKWLRAMLLRDERALSWCLGQGMDVRGAMSEGSNTDGGFLVPDEFSQTIIDLREQYGVYRREAQVIPMGRDTMLIPRRLGGVTIGAIGENPASAISQSNPTFNQVQLVAKKAGGLTLMSTEIAEDAVIDMADWVAREFAYGFAKFEDQCGFTGDGTSTYLGIQGLGNLLTEANAATYAGAVTVATATHDLFSEIDNTDLTTMMSKLPQYARANAKFYCSALCLDLVFNRLKAIAGGNDVGTLGMGPSQSYLGYPIVISQVLPAVTTTLDALPMLYFGDLSMAATLGDRREVRVFPSEHRYMDTDQIGIRGTERFDIVNHDLGDGTTAGPIVALTGSTS